MLDLTASNCKMKMLKDIVATALTDFSQMVNLGRFVVCPLIRTESRFLMGYLQSIELFKTLKVPGPIALVLVLAWFAAHGALGVPAIEQSRVN